MCIGSTHGRVWRLEEGNKIQISWTRKKGDCFRKRLSWIYYQSTKLVFYSGRGGWKKKKERQKEKLAPFSSSAPDLHNTFKWRRFHRAHFILRDTLELEQQGFASVKRTARRRQQGLAFVSIARAGGGDSLRKGCLTLTCGAKRLEPKQKNFPPMGPPPCCSPKSSRKIRATISYCQGLINKKIKAQIR